MWGVPLRLQLWGLAFAAFVLLARTWTNWEPGAASVFLPSSRIVVSKRLDALPTEASDSPRTPRDKLAVRREPAGLRARKLIDTHEGGGSSAADVGINEAKADDEEGAILLNKAKAEAAALNEKISLWRHKMGKKLRAAKKAVAKVSAADADPSLNADIYHNVAAFSKSYELMEKVFRIYTYTEGAKPFVHAGPVTGIYASEGLFIAHMRMAGNRFAVRDPWRALMFFMPFSVKNMEAQLYVPDSQSLRPITRCVTDYVDTLKSRHPFWNLSAGADHFFVSCHDWGPLATSDHSELHRNAVKVVCNADTSLEEYSLGRDVSLPEINIHYLVDPEHIGGPGPAERPTLAFFAGQMHGPVRPVLVEHWQRDPDMVIRSVLENEIKKPFYIESMRTSRYCVCAQGFEVNSPRIVEAIYQDCVPVIIADHIVLPFADVLDWAKFSVTVPAADIPNLKAILQGIPDERYHAMQRRLKSVRPHFLWSNQTDVKYDVFHMILHSIWSSRLQRLDSPDPVAPKSVEARR